MLQRNHIKYHLDDSEVHDEDGEKDEKAIAAEKLINPATWSQIQ